MVSPDNLEELYDAHAQGLYSFLVNFTRSEADTRDILQEVFIKLAQRLSPLNGVRDERAFLLRLAHNLALDLFRRRSTRERNCQQWVEEVVSLFAEASSPDEQTFRKALACALSEIPAEQRAIVHLKLWESLTFEQIAELLDLSPNTAASRYRYGIDKLRQRLRPLYDEINET